MQVLWGQMPPSTGTILYTKESHDMPVEEVYKNLTIATPYLDLIEELTLQEQLEFHFALKKSRNEMTISEMLDKMELTHARDKAIRNFSSGMKQRTKLALGFFTASDVLFLDEPGTNLDVNSFAWYQSLLEEVLGKQLIFIASNQPDEYPQDAVKIEIMDYK